MAYEFENVTVGVSYLQHLADPLRQASAKNSRWQNRARGVKGEERRAGAGATGGGGGNVTLDR